MVNFAPENLVRFAAEYLASTPRNTGKLCSGMDGKLSSGTVVNYGAEYARPEFGEVLSSLREPAYMVVNHLVEILKSDPAQAFLLYTDSSQPPNAPYVVLSKYNPDVEDVSSFFLSGFLKLWRIQNPHSLATDEDTQLDKLKLLECRSLSDRDVNPVKLSNAYHSIHDYSHLEKRFFNTTEVGTEEIAILSDEVRAHLKQLSEVRTRTAILDMVVYLLNNLNPNLHADQASVLRMLEEHWRTHVIDQKPSRLRIDEHYRIFLTDYGNQEITMSRLPKLLFLFYLQHPEGVSFRNLKRHRAELKAIYSKLTNRSDTAVIESSIDRLIDVHQNNSINEKCSRIREAFEKEISSSAAAPYIIQGPKGGVKQISLDRDLVDFGLH